MMAKIQLMPNLETLRTIRKVIQEKQKHGEDLAEGAAHVPQPGKKTAREESHGAHKETDAEKAGGQHCQVFGEHR